jgi:predicted membrane protein
MTSRNPTRSAPTVIFGLLIILIGVFLLLDNFRILYARDYLMYWPVALILLGILKSLEPSGMAGRTSWGIVALVGVLLLLDNLEVIFFRLWDLWPLVLVLIGFGLLRGAFGARARSFFDGRASHAGSDDATISVSAIAGGSSVSNASGDFQGGSITAVMGGTKVDLRSASIKRNDARLDLFTVWGGIELLVPKEWEVEIRLSPILGGVEDKTHHPGGAGAPRLILTGTVIMAGAEVKN